MRIKIAASILSANFAQLGNGSKKRMKEERITLEEMAEPIKLLRRSASQP